MPRKLLPPTSSAVPIEIIERKIYLVRGRRVMLDMDIALIYRVETRVLVQAVKRNMDRFPEDFMFQLSKEELENWRSQIVISNPAARMSLRRQPYAFTEHGALMLASVLKSQRAVQMSIFVVRAFTQLREFLATHKALARKMEILERKQAEHGEQLAAVYSIVKQLIHPPTKLQKRIGFALADKELTK